MKDGKVYKIYVWHDVLVDYTSGMIVIHATSLKEAYEIAIKEDKKKESYSNLYLEIKDKKPDKVISKNSIDFVYGGG